MKSNLSVCFYVHSRDVILKGSVPRSHLASFCQRISNLLDHGQIGFGNAINMVVEKLTNLWKHDFEYAIILV